MTCNDNNVITEKNDNNRFGAASEQQRLPVEKIFHTNGFVVECAPFNGCRFIDGIDSNAEQAYLW